MRAFFQRRRLFQRVFLHGLTVLASAVAFAVLAALLLLPTLDRNTSAFGKWLAPALCHALVSGSGRSADAEAPEVTATLYSEDGRLLGSFIAPPLPPLSATDAGQLFSGATVTARGGSVHAFACAGEPRAYVEIGPPALHPPTGLFALAAIVVVLLVAVASVPFARSIARPIERVVETTRAFGRGDLSARVADARGDDVGDLSRAFNDMANRLQKLIVAEKELLANVSHELRTPLARIRVVLEMAREAPQRAQVLLGEIGLDLADVERLVEDVMDAMRLDMGALALSERQLPARLEPVDLGDLVADAVGRFADMHPERRIELDHARVPLETLADRRLVRRLLDNLLDNARKYSDPSSAITVRVGLSHRAPEARGGDTELIEVAVIDEGIGIDEADLDHVFDPFFRSDRSRSRATGGAGLGLALAKRIVDLHEGKIWLRSEPDVGTQVVFALRASLLRCHQRTAEGLSPAAPRPRSP